MRISDWSSDVCSSDLGHAEIAGAMLPPPHGVWGLPVEQLDGIPGYGPDVEKNREEAREIMRSLGYGPDKPLQIKIATRNIAGYRDPAIIMIDHLSQIFIAGEIAEFGRASCRESVCQYG